MNDETSIGTVNRTEKENDLSLMGHDVYREFRLRGHNYGGKFQGITYVNEEGMSTYICWFF